MPDAGGLVIASDHADARAYAALLRRITGARPVVVLSDDPAASKKIAEFAQSEDRLDGRGPDGLRGRGHPAAGRRGLRHQRQHRAVLRPGRRPVRAGAPARRDRLGVPAVGSAAAAATPPSWRPSATTCWPAPATTSRGTRAGRGAAPAGHPRRAGRRRRSRRWRPRRTSTGCSTTAASSARTLAPRRRTSSACPGCWSREQVSLLLRKRQADQASLAAGRAAAARSRIGPGAPVSALAAHTPHAAAPARRRGPGGAATARVGQGEPGRAAQGAQLTGHGLAPPDRPAARRHPRRAAPVLRRTAGAASHRRPAARAHKRAAPVGVGPPLTTFVRDNSRNGVPGPIRAPR